MPIHKLSAMNSDCCPIRIDSTGAETATVIHGPGENAANSNAAGSATVSLVRWKICAWSTASEPVSLTLLVGDNFHPLTVSLPQTGAPPTVVVEDMVGSARARPATPATAATRVHSVARTTRFPQLCRPGRQGSRSALTKMEFLIAGSRGIFGVS